MKKNIIFILYILLFIPLMAFAEDNQEHVLKYRGIGSFYPGSGCENTGGVEPSYLCQKYTIDDEDATCLDPDISNPDYINTYEVLDTSTPFGRGLIAMSNYAKINDVDSRDQAHAYRIYTMKVNPLYGGGVIGPIKIGLMQNYSSSDNIGQMVSIGVCAANNQSNCNGLNTDDFLPNSSSASVDAEFSLNKLDQDITTNGGNFIVTANVEVIKSDENLKLNPTGCSADGYKCEISKNNVNSDGTLQIKVNGKQGKNQSVKVYIKFSGAANSGDLITEIGLYSCEPSKGKCIDLNISAEHSKRQYFTPYQRFIKLLTGNETTQNGSNYIIIDLPSVCDDPNLTPKQLLENGCCSKIDPSTLGEDSEDEDTYIKYCGPIVKTENKCGKDSCEEDSYVDFSHSYVKLRNMDYILKDLEKGLSDSNYLDESFNSYCGIYTTEKLDILTPATAASVSGQFFIFDSYTKNDYSNINSYFRQPYVVERVKSAFFFNYTSWKAQYDRLLNEETNAYNTWQKAVENVKNTYDAWQTAIKNVPIKEAIYNNWLNPSSSLPYAVCNSSTKYYNQQKCNNNRVIAQWDSDNAIADRDAAETTYKESLTTEETTRGDYRSAVTNRMNIQGARDECMTKADEFKNNYTFNFDGSTPNVKFTYSQNSQKEGNQTYTFDMVENTEAVKYWPNITSGSSTADYGGDKSIANNTTQNITHNGVYLIDEYGNTGTYNFPNSTYDGCSGNKCTEYKYNGYIYSARQGKTDATDPYGKISVKDSETISKIYYYRPENNTFALMNSGEYKTLNYESNADHASTNGLQIGYVYNIELTAYKGSYDTAFAVSNYGYKTNGGRYLIKELLEEFNIEFSLDGSLTSKCSYCNMEMAFKRNCDICDPNTTYDFEPQFYYRSISLADVTPTEREVETNWTDAKGSAAEELIRQGSGTANVDTGDSSSNYIAVATNNFKENKGNIATYLADSSSVGKHDIYDDSTKEYLEYEVTLTSQDLKTIKRNSSRAHFDYSKMKMCTGNSAVISKDSDTEYCFTCNSDMKECESTFITSYFTDTKGRERWKYYVNGTFCRGTIKQCIKGLNYITYDNSSTDGVYPDPLFPKEFLNTYKNWP